jgi:hypothetical protein
VTPHNGDGCDPTERVRFGPQKGAVVTPRSGSSYPQNGPAVTHGAGARCDPTEPARCGPPTDQMLTSISQRVAPFVLNRQACPIIEHPSNLRLWRYGLLHRFNHHKSFQGPMLTRLAPLSNTRRITRRLSSLVSRVPWTSRGPHFGVDRPVHFAAGSEFTVPNTGCGCVLGDNAFRAAVVGVPPYPSNGSENTGFVASVARLAMQFWWRLSAVRRHVGMPSTSDKLLHRGK